METSHHGSANVSPLNYRLHRPRKKSQRLRQGCAPSSTLQRTGGRGGGGGGAVLRALVLGAEIGKDVEIALDSHTIRPFLLRWD